MKVVSFLQSTISSAFRTETVIIFLQVYSLTDKIAWFRLEIMHLFSAITEGKKISKDSCEDNMLIFINTPQEAVCFLYIVASVALYPNRVGLFLKIQYCTFRSHKIFH